MKRFILWLLLLGTLTTSSFFLNSVREANGAPKRMSFSEAGEVGLILVEMLGIRELVVGYLWMQFDFDSASVLGSYHRLLPTLDAITWLDPHEIDAWGLKTYMRMRQGRKEKNTRKVEESIRAFQRALEANPGHWEFPFEIGRQVYFTLASPGRALPYIEKAVSFPDRHINVDKVYANILVDLHRIDAAIPVIKNILTSPDIDPAEKKSFQKWMETLLKPSSSR